jgi:hypothetical protein
VYFTTKNYDKAGASDFLEHKTPVNKFRKHAGMKPTQGSSQFGVLRVVYK